MMSATFQLELAELVERGYVLEFGYTPEGHVHRSGTETVRARAYWVKVHPPGMEPRTLYGRTQGSVWMSVQAEYAHGP